MSEAVEYRLVVRSGQSTLHKYPSKEECNLDSTDSDIKVDADTADAVVRLGDAVRCSHCFLGVLG